MEVMAATVILSVVMLALIKVKNENIYLLEKSKENTKSKDYIALAIDLNKAENRNQNIFLDRLVRFDNDDIRKELKPIKIKQKDEKHSSKTMKNDEMDLTVTTYSTSYSLTNGVKKKIYTFRIEL